MGSYNEEMNNITDEIKDKREKAIHDFNNLISDGVVGFYQECEFTQIFLLEAKTDNIYNYFTIINLEENINDLKRKFLTKSPFEINDRFKLGIIQIRLSLSELIIFFNNLLNLHFNVNNKESIISKSFVLLPKQHIPHYWGGKTPLINHVIKPNIWGNNYIVEFFDESKDIINLLNRKEIDKINNLILSCKDIKIDFFKVYDRIGNILFQFPITLFKFVIDLQKNDNDVIYKIFKHPKLKNDFELNLIFKTSKDNIITGYKNLISKTSQMNILIELGDSNELEVYISNKETSILYYSSQNIFLKYFNINMNIVNSYIEPRIIKNKNGSINKIDIVTPMPITGGRRSRREYIDHIQKRIIENEIILNSGDFAVFNNNERQKAIKYISEKIINSIDIKELYLWDPYLCALDIIETLYFENTGKPFKCITTYQGLKKIIDGEYLSSRKKSPFMNLLLSPILYIFYYFKKRKIINSDENKSKLINVRKNQIKQFKEYSNNVNINLEFRCQYKNLGYPFHDRFLIFVPNDEFALPIVYSLGASVNQLGEKHHIIHKVTDPRIILENFNNLWNSLNSEECIILKLPEQKDLLNE